MFTIVISEKGGAERRETFEKTEITVGRVQGNDLMLPKGNVSKHHARLLCRDGRFIVTDLKSTNGTYVNGRKTSQATIVREGDKIYIGDFVLRVETGQAVLGAPSVRSEVTVPRPPLGAPPASATGLVPGQLSGPPPAQGRAQELSHYPLERDPDSESAPELTGAAIPVVPGPPRVPQTVGLRPGAIGGAPAALPRGTTAIQPVRARSPEPRQPAPVDGVGWRETRKQSARRVALITLVDRVADVVDLAPLDRSPEIEPTVKEQVERAIREQTKAMRADGEVPEGVDPEQLAADAARELLSLGPLGPALEDDEVSEIHVARADSVVVEKKGERQLLADGLFTSEEAVARAVARLAQRSGQARCRSSDVFPRERRWWP
jgi:pilus assembly protein CpaF